MVHYDASGVLSELSRDPTSPLAQRGAVDALLATTALLHWRVFDNTKQVSFLSATKISLGDAKSSLGDGMSSLGDGMSSLGDAMSSLGNTESSLLPGAGDGHAGVGGACEGGGGCETGESGD